MQITELDEPISVLAVFRPESIQPVKFRWNGRDYKVEAINSHWQDREGSYMQYYFSVQVADTTFHLRLNGEDLLWSVERSAS